MSLAEKDISAFLTLGFPIDGEMFTDKTGSAVGHSRLATDGPAHRIPVALANAVSGYKVRKSIARAWPGSELDCSIGHPQVAVAPLIGDLSWP